jgi:S-adenosylmethionine:tRNA ribosyltransferase-isomerase
LLPIMPTLFTSDFTYHLPQERIAVRPLEQRDQAKLLVFEDKKIDHRVFQDLSALLPKNTFLFFNDTKVIPARIHFKKDTGADIEVFLLHPIKPSAVLAETMQATASCVWQCTIGNLKRWPDDLSLVKKVNDISIRAQLLNREDGTVQFTWSCGRSFAEIIDQAGETPLPPYLKRKPEQADKERYQTIYSHHEGAVAAPTAGLHFTNKVFDDLTKRNIQHDFLTLHVSAGTFQPIKTENAIDHTMHEEQIVVKRKNIENLLLDERTVIPVGTTSMRTLESIYWFGAKLVNDPETKFKVYQNDPYENMAVVSKSTALRAIIDRMNKESCDQLIGETSIFIRPGYTFKICDALITNFHQPGSTLILLVAALIGPAWKAVYEEALKNNYRFLSYGDSSLLFPPGDT